MKTRRRGYTLFQLLVLLAFLVILLGMMFPATLQVRASAARIQSQNNLKQLGIAIHSYHDVMGKMPSGADAKGFSGLAYLLPYIEQANVFRLIDFTTSPEAAGNARARATIFKTFLNPQDEIHKPDEKSGPTNYFLVAGTKPALAANDGLFFRDSKVRFAEITDGLSNTLMATESLPGDSETNPVTVQRQHVLMKKEDLKGIADTAGVKEFADGKGIVSTRGSSWMDGRFLSSTLNLTRKLNDERPDVDCGGDGGLAGPRSTQGGVNVLLGDGSVRFVTSKTSHDTWKAAATRAGGEVLGPDW